MEQMEHKAWCWDENGRVMYVQAAREGEEEDGERYSYTNDAKMALPMTANQCRLFCRYMRQCGIVGYWR